MPEPQRTEKRFTRWPSLLRNLCFSWVTPFIRANFLRPLDSAGLLPLPPDQDVASDTLRFAAALHRDPQRRLTRAIAYVFRSTLLTVFLFGIVLLTSSVGNPLILRRLIQALSSHPPTPPEWIHYIGDLCGIAPTTLTPLLLAGALSLSTVIAIISVHNMFYHTNVLAFRVRAVISALIYQKSLTLSSSARESCTTGFILNLLSVDSPKIMHSLIMIHSLFFHPTQIILVITLLYGLLGLPALVATLVIICILFLSLLLGKSQTRSRAKLSRASDNRVTLLHEVLSHMKAIKLQSLEEILTARIDHLRSQELTHSRRMALATSGMLFFSSTGAALALCAALAVAVYRGDTLHAETIFPALALLTVLRFALGVLPETVFTFAEALVALRRIDGFLLLPNQPHVPIQPMSPYGVQALDAHFKWPNGLPALKLEALTIARGELVAVVGSVGAGKSALLKALGGELVRAQGSISLAGPVTLLPQEPWILSDTIRNNILCGTTCDEELYARCLEASGLQPDLASLPQGDQTTIGERGINLSGGQRQRVALARALYAQPTVVLLDDPLSALDPQVAEHVFQNAIVTGLSATTRIMVTHRLEFALRADRVIVMEGGAVIEDGSPEILKANQARFSELFAYHAHTNLIDSPYDKHLVVPSAADPEFDEPSLSEADRSSVTVAEERAYGALRKSTLLRYLALLSPRSARAGLCLLLTLFLGRQLFLLSADLWVARYADGRVTDLASFISGYLPLLLLLCGFTALRALYVLWRGLSAGVLAHQLLVRGLLAAPMRFFESHPVGRIINRCSADVSTVETILPRNLLDAAHHLLEMLCIIAFVVVSFPMSAGLMVPLVMLYYLILRSYRPTAREGQRLESIARSPTLALLSESIAGASTIRLGGLQDIFCRHFYAFVDELTKTSRSMNAANRWLGVRIESVGAFIIPVVTVCAVCAPSTQAHPGIAALLLTYSLSIMSSMNWFGRTLVLIESNLTSFERIQTYAHTPPERWDGRVTPPTDWPERGALTCQELCVRYRAGLPLALKSISFSIPPQQRVGIVGRSGSGKSTLIAALTRLVEVDSGSVTLDGVDLASVDLKRLRRAITVVPQEPVLLSGTVRDNVDPFASFSDSAVLEALHRVEYSDEEQAPATILNFRILEGGRNLSSGERQLLCLARALLYGARVVVLDEATAYVDLETDHKLQKVIRREFSDTTVLVIAHRIETIADSDQILCLQDGRVVTTEALPV